ncbi:MAG: hypothetical protein AAF483_27815, partial [Planctomycetota bacterium]
MKSRIEVFDIPNHVWGTLNSDEQRMLDTIRDRVRNNRNHNQNDDRNLPNQYGTRQDNDQEEQRDANEPSTTQTNSNRSNANIDTNNLA